MATATVTPAQKVSTPVLVSAISAAAMFLMYLTGTQWGLLVPDAAKSGFVVGNGAWHLLTLPVYALAAHATCRLIVERGGQERSKITLMALVAGAAVCLFATPFLPVSLLAPMTFAFLVLSVHAISEARFQSFLMAVLPIAFVSFNVAGVLVYSSIADINALPFGLNQSIAPDIAFLASTIGWTTWLSVTLFGIQVVASVLCWRLTGMTAVKATLCATVCVYSAAFVFLPLL